MRLSHLIVVTAVLWFTPLVARAQPATWDSRGWVMLGEREVHGHGRMERDVMPVGRQDGRFNRLTIVVENSDLEMVDFAVKFERGEAWHPGVSHFFREGQRTRVIEFPETAWGNTARAIAAIEFAYRNVPGEGHARVQVWGWRTGATTVAVPPPPPPAPAWDSRGWVQLGEREVHGHGRMERDVMPIGRQDGRFGKLTIVVDNSDLEMVDFAVKFEHGAPWHPGVSHFFREGQRTRVIEFPETAWGNTARSIAAIEFAYRNVPGEGHARVQVWGWRNAEASAPPPAPVWNSQGWMALGEREVHGHGRMERDHIEVGRQDGKFSQITIVVENSDLEMIDFTVNFTHGDPWHPGISHVFREGQRTRVLELPASMSGHAERAIQSIDFAYRNVPGEGHARVQVWAR
ncbi:MAG TPA: hypothetical protein VGF94_04625 [Kofleriaceae bacterium]|jgi:hypothetical protein